MNMIGKVAVASVFALSVSQVSAQSASGSEPKGSLSEAQCAQIQEEFEPMKKQLPLEVDYMTTITGLSAIQMKSNCLVSFSYSFKEDVMVDEVVKGSKGALDFDQALAFLKSEEGRNILKTILRQQAEAIFSDLGANAPGIKYQMSYRSDGVNLRPITFQF